MILIVPQVILYYLAVEGVNLTMVLKNLKADEKGKTFVFLVRHGEFDFPRELFRIQDNSRICFLFDS